MIKRTRKSRSSTRKASIMVVQQTIIKGCDGWGEDLKEGSKKGTPPPHTPTFSFP
ncbi:MAG: hypothetical protein GF329_07845 [Candidatus Lokiarchaeota archaeon]|nr:hypothetical protein [Candidatus Lokiarchaeota archaeon]